MHSSTIVFAALFSMLALPALAHGGGGGGGGHGGGGHSSSSSASSRAAANNRSNQMNPNNDAYWSSRGFDGRPSDWEERVDGDGDYATTGHGDSPPSTRYAAEPLAANPFYVPQAPHDDEDSGGTHWFLYGAISAGVIWHDRRRKKNRDKK